MDDRSRDAAGAGQLDDAQETATRALRELLHRLGTRDDVPALLLEDRPHEGVAVGGADAQLAAFPLAEVNLGEIGDHRWLQACRSDQRRRGLHGAPQRGDEQGVRRGGRQARADQRGLLLTDR